MRRPAAPFLTALLLAGLCVSSLAADADPAALILEMTGQAEAQKRAAAEWKAAYETVVDHLLPGMGSDDVKARGNAQTTFEAIALAAGRPGANVQRTALATIMADRMTRTSNTEAKVWLLRQLQYIGQAESVPALAQALGAGEPQVRECARRALQRNSSPEAGAALRHALAKANDTHWQVAFINALADRRDPAAVGLVAKHLGASNADLDRAAIAGLGRLGTPQAVDALKQAVGGAKGERRVILLDALLSAAEFLLKDGNADAAFALYESLNTDASPDRVRMGATYGMTLANPDQAGLAITRAVTGANAALRRFALTLVPDAPGGDATTRVFAGLLPKLTADDQVMLVRNLAARGDGAAKPAILTAVASADEAVRTAAVAAMGQLGSAEDVVRLATMAADAEGDMKKAALSSLVQLRGVGVDAAIIAALAKVDPAPRAELIRALGTRQATDAASGLVGYLGDADPAVRTASAETLGAIGGPAAIAPIAKVLADGQDKERQAARKAIHDICDRIADKAACAGAILQLTQSAKADVQAMLLPALATTGTDAALAAVRTRLKATDEGVREAAIRALADWPNAKPVDDLLGVARTAAKDSHKVLALRGYVRLVGLTDAPEAERSAMYREAMASATRPQEKRLVLSALATAPSVATLEIAQAQIATAELKDEAALATATIATRIVAAYPNEAAAAAEAVLANSTNKTARKEAQKALNFLTRFDNYMTAWMMAGPYTEGDAFKTEYPPEKGAKDVAWKSVRPTNPNEPWRVDLGRLIGGSNRCAYLRTYLIADANQDVRLEIGTDDGVKVWLNGKVVHEVNTSRGLTPGQDKVQASLKRGVNEMLMKVTQLGGGWEACARVRRPDGSAVKGIRVRARPD